MGFENIRVTGILTIPRYHHKSAKLAKAYANTFAALTELMHFTNSPESYSELFDSSEDPVVGVNRPFDKTELIQSTDDGAAVGVNESEIHSGQILFLNLLSPIGRDSERIRQTSRNALLQEASTRTTGFSRMVWPRQKFLNAAVLEGCRRFANHLINTQHAGLDNLSYEWLQEQGFTELVDVNNLKEQLTHGELPGTLQPHDALSAVLRPFDSTSSVNEQSILPITQQWHAALAELGLASSEKPGKCAIEAMFQVRVAAITESLAAKLASVVLNGVNTPSIRLGGVESALRQLCNNFKIQFEKLSEAIESWTKQSTEIAERQETLLRHCAAPKRGTNRQELLQNFASNAHKLSQAWLQALATKSLKTVFEGILQAATELIQELHIGRNQIERAQKELSVSASVSCLAPSQANTMEIYPSEHLSLDEAVADWLDRLPAESWSALDEEFERRLQQNGIALSRICDPNFDISTLLAKEIEQATSCLFERIVPGSSLVNLLKNVQAISDRLDDGVKKLVELSRPPLTTGTPKTSDDLYLAYLPADDVDQSLAARIDKIAPEFELALAETENKIDFYCERVVRVQELPHMSESARMAAQAMTQTGAISPFSRADLSWSAGREDSEIKAQSSIAQA